MYAIRIAVIGERNASQELLEAAENVGREIARRKAILICGAMGGVMEAASRGASSAGGTVVGIIPTQNAADANPYVSIPIVTGMGEGRNIIVVRSAHVVISIGGSYGTLSEIALALRLGLPVVGLHTWTFAREAGDRDPILRVSDPAEAVDRALSAVAAIHPS